MAQDAMIQQGYDSLGVNRTDFSTKNSKIEKQDAAYLDRLFAVTDEIMVVRLSALQQLYHNANVDTVKDYNRVVDDMLGRLSQSRAPQHLAYVETTIISAIREQQQFLNQWASAKDTPEFDHIKNSYAAAPLVSSSHQKLLDAYGELMGIYAYENGHNKKAFYSHLCALDFI